MSLLAITWNVDPIIFQIGSFGIRYYSLLFALGFVIGYFIVKRIYKAEGIPISELDNLVIYVVVGGLLGARLAHCVFYDWEYYLSGWKEVIEIILPISFYPELHFVGYQGLASHGGAVGIIIAMLLFRRKSTQKNILCLLDRIAIPTGFAGACIRLGNLFNSEIYGHPTDKAWGFIFVQNGDTWASHPTQIYEALCYIVTSLVLMYLYKIERFRNARGFLLGVFLILVFTARFFIEFLKNNQVGFEESLALNMGQWLSIPFVIGGGLLIYFSLKLNNKQI
jgi:phosphatidylglycerol---prolipoprotein diacylglyceryl transferase